MILGSVILVFSFLLIYLNILLFELKKEKIEAQSQNLISQSFFSIPYNEEDLHQYVEELMNRQSDEISIHELKPRFQSIFSEYNTVATKIDRVFAQMGLKVRYKWTISIPKFEIRDSDKITALIDSKNERSKELVLFGKSEIKPEATPYLFYKIGDHHFNQVNLYIEFLDIYTVIAKQLVPIIIVDVFLILLFILTMRHSIRTLLQQHKMVRLQTDLLNAVSHEFNTPLSTIQIGGQALLKLKERADSDIINEVAHSIIRQQGYLKNLVDQILTLGISERKEPTIDTGVYVVEAFIKDIGNRWMEDKNKAEVFLKMQRFPDCEVMIDPHLIKLMLFNILDNALKYSDKKPVVIELWGSIKGRKLNLFVHDNGPGIHTLDVKNILKKFYRGKNAKNSKGLGLGLYLVDRIIKMHQGTCKIGGNTEEGTKVTITLPIYYE